MSLSLRLHTRWLRCRAWVLLVLNQPAAALACFESILEHSAGQDQHAASSRAHLLARLGQRDQAIEAMWALSRQWPTDGVIWFNLGFMLEQAGRLDEAAHAFGQAVQCRPDLDRAWYGLGLVLIQLGRLDEAVDALRRNTELQPMSPYGWYQLARVHADRQQPEEALRIIRRLRGFEPKVAAQLERETGLLAPTSGAR